jgi:hypothetical protein
MGHLHWVAVFHLPQAGIGAVVEGKKPKEVCEPCQLASGLHQVSRRPHTREETPFARVYYDLIQMRKAYNGDQWITHMLDETSYTQYTHLFRRMDHGRRNLARKDCPGHIRPKWPILGWGGDTW